MQECRTWRYDFNITHWEESTVNWAILSWLNSCEWPLNITLSVRHICQFSKRLLLLGALLVHLCRMYYLCVGILFLFVFFFTRLLRMEDTIALVGKKYVFIQSYVFHVHFFCRIWLPPWTCSARCRLQTNRSRGSTGSSTRWGRKIKILMVA